MFYAMDKLPNSFHCFSWLCFLSYPKKITLHYCGCKRSKTLLFPFLFSDPAFFQLPHSLSLDEQNRHLFVADRENSRVLVFDSVNGSFVREIKEFGDRVFVAHYNPEQGDCTIVLVFFISSTIH